MPGMYGGGDYDLAGFAVGAVERDKILPQGNIAKGDVVLGLASSGVHSNGYSLVRKIVGQEELIYDKPAPFDASRSLGDALLGPTRIYVRPIKNVLRHYLVKRVIRGMAHITGGGLVDNIPRVLPQGLGVELDLARIGVTCSVGWRPRAALRDPKCCALSNAGSAWLWSSSELWPTPPRDAGGPFLHRITFALDEPAQEGLEIACQLWKRNMAQAIRHLLTRPPAAVDLPVVHQGTHITGVKINPSVRELADMAAQQGQHGQQQRTGRQAFYTGVTAHIMEQSLRLLGSTVPRGWRLASRHPCLICLAPLVRKGSNFCVPKIQDRDVGQVARQTRLTIAHNAAGDGKAIAT